MYLQSETVMIDRPCRMFNVSIIQGCSQIDRFSMQFDCMQLCRREVSTQLILFLHSHLFPQSRLIIVSLFNYMHTLHRPGFRILGTKATVNCAVII